MHPSGYEEARVEMISDLQDLNPRKHALKISGRLGAKKRIELIDYAQKRNFKILNIGVTQKVMEEYEAMLESPIEGLEEEDEEFWMRTILMNLLMKKILRMRINNNKRDEK